MELEDLLCRQTLALRDAPEINLRSRSVGSIVVVSDDGEFEKLSERLRDAGIVEVYHRRWNDFDAPIRDNCGLAVLIAPRLPTSDWPIRAFRWLQLLGSVLHANRGRLVGVSQFGGQFGLNTPSESDPLGAALSGLIKTAAREWDNVACRIIDVDGFSQVAVNEILARGPLEMGIRSNRRQILELVHSPPPPHPERFRISAGDLVIATGGARGVTSSCCLELANQFRPTFLILGRTNLNDSEPPWSSGISSEIELKRAIVASSNTKMTPRDIQNEYRRILALREANENLSRLRNAGSSVMYECVDAIVSNAVSAFIDRARQAFGPVRGIIHGAGVLADKRIEDKTVDQFERVFRTKTEPLRSLLNETISDPLAFVALFSSTTARFGRIGQCDYAAANEVLNQIARHHAHRRPDCRFVAFNWGPWDGGMVTPELRAMFAKENVGVIPIATGARLFVDEATILDGPPDVIVMQSLPVNPKILQLNFESCPYLRDHVIRGRGVLPLAVVLEWAFEYAPGTSAIADLHVLRPIAVKPDESIRLSLLERDKYFSLSVDSTANNSPVIPPNITWRRAPLPENLPPMLTFANLKPYPLTIDEIYAGVLFHGPYFQVIKHIHGWNDIGIRIEAYGTTTQCIDAALQAVILWTWSARRELSLPVAIGMTLFSHDYQRNTMGVTVDVKITLNKGSVLRASITIRDLSDQPLIQLHDCEFVVDPSLRSAFAHATEAAK